MHNNYYLLRQLARELNTRLAGFTVVSCFTQNKDELILELNNRIESFFIKASLQSDFSCLSFPTTFHRARKNSIDLFSPVVLKKVEKVFVFQNERSFEIDLEENISLIFKMHGNRANVLLLVGGSVKEVFRNHLKTDFEITPEHLHKEIDWSRECFSKNRFNLSKIYFTFGKPVQHYLDTLGYQSASEEAQWRLVQQVISELENPDYYLIDKEGNLSLSLLKWGSIQRTYHAAIPALNEFFLSHAQADAFVKEKSKAVQELRDKIKNAQGYLAKNQTRLEELERDNHWQIWGDLIMANMHRIKTGEGSASVENFYDHNAALVIPLKKELSAQKNAEVFYRKSKNQHIEISKLKEAIARKQKELTASISELAAVDSSVSLKDLRTSTPTKITTKSGAHSVSLPYHEFIYKGFRIWVGKDAESNDELTQKLSFKEDLWLHAKDVSGSHVLIKYQSGKNFPKDVIERAAELAAYNSKRKTDSLCPVQVTPKKFVRKRKGDPPGAVVVEREDVILVEPKLN